MRVKTNPAQEYNRNLWLCLILHPTLLCVLNDSLWSKNNTSKTTHQNQHIKSNTNYLYSFELSYKQAIYILFINNDICQCILLVYSWTMVTIASDHNTVLVWTAQSLNCHNCPQSHVFLLKNTFVHNNFVFFLVDYAIAS